MNDVTRPVPAGRIRTLVPRVAEGGPRRAELQAIARHSAPRIAVAAGVGAAVGLLVAGLDRMAAVEFGERLDEVPLWALAIMPLLGLVVSAAALLTIGGGADSSTADEYLAEFHGMRRSRPRQVAARMVGAVATVGSGGAVGLEGPSIHLGSALGSAVQRRLPRLFAGTDKRTLLVAGAAAAVAAIFKAPATGAVFAIEVPYQDDQARRVLMPALVAAATGYVAFVLVNGTEPLLEIVGEPGFGVRDLGGAVVLGVLAGVVARTWAAVLRRTKRSAHRHHMLLRAVSAGLVMVGLFAATEALTGERLTIGPGYSTIRWALEDHATWLILVVLAMRCAATTAIVAGGGVGGVFIPLVTAGALLGRAVAGPIDALDTSLFTVVGMAAVLGAGYRVPLAAVTFVAESTGRPGFVVPGLLAAVAADLVMGTSSVTGYQQRDPA